MTASTHMTDEQVQAYLEGLLPEPDACAADDHLAACSTCQALAMSYRSLSAALGMLDRPPLPPLDFTAGVLERIDARRRAEARMSMVILSVAIPLAAGLFALAGPAAWAAALSSASSLLGSVTSALHLGVNVLLPVLYALQLEILIVCSIVALLLFSGLSRVLAPGARKFAHQRGHR